MGVRVSAPISDRLTLNYWAVNGTNQVEATILWVLRTGAPWADLPEAYPSFQTCHRRFQQWVRSGVMKGILEALALDLKLRGAIEVREAFIDASFAPAKKGA